MKVSDGKIVEISEAELFDMWLERGMDDLMSFPDYVHSFRTAGCKVPEGAMVR